MVESWPVLTVLTIVLLFFAWGVVGLLGKMQTTRENRKIAENKLAELEQQKGKLAASIQNLKTDEGKEQIFREDYGLAKDGEGLIVVVDDQNPPGAPSTGGQGFFSKLFFWKNWFK